MEITHPDITANQIEAYKGDAALGYGGAGGIDNTGNPQSGNPVGGIQSTLDRIAQADEVMRMEHHREKIEKQKAMVNALHQQNGSPFNMADPQTGKNISFQPLPEDQKILNEQANNITRNTVANPDTYQFSPELQKQTRLHQEQAHAAGQRSMFRAQEMLAASQEQDPVERQKIIANMNKQLTENPIDNFRGLVPHIPASKLTNDIIEKDWVKEESRQQIGGMTGKPTSVIDKPLHDLSKESIQNSANWATAFLHQPEAQNPAYLQRVNAANQQYAKERGVTPIDIARIDPQTGQISYNPNPREIYTALRRYEHGGLYPSEKAIEKQDAHLAAKQALRKSEFDMRMANDKNIRENNAESAAELKEKQNNYIGSYALSTSYDVVNDLKGMDYIPAKEYAKDKNSPLGQYLTSQGVSVKNAKIAILAPSATFDKIMAVPGKDLDGKETGTMLKMDNGYFINEHPENPMKGKFLFAYKRIHPARKESSVTIPAYETTETKVIPAKEMPMNVVISMNNGSGLDDEKSRQASRAMMEFNGQNTPKEGDIKPLSSGKKAVYRNGKWGLSE